MSTKKKARQFTIGDRVTWSSQSQGSTTTKTGTVIEVVEPGKIARTSGFGFNRFTYERYVVAVPQPATKRGKPRPDALYFPVKVSAARGRKPAAKPTMKPELLPNEKVDLKKRDASSWTW